MPDSSASAPTVPTFAAWASAIRDLGFPVVVASVLLWHFLVVLPQQHVELVAAVKQAAERLDQVQQTQVRILEMLRAK